MNTTLRNTLFWRGSILTVIIGLVLSVAALGSQWGYINLTGRTPVAELSAEGPDGMELDIPFEQWKALPVESEAELAADGEGSDQVQLVAASAARSSAMRTAMGKVGTPYRWGASGPNAFDCSGLVKYSFAQHGKTLPRTSTAQSRVGKPVSRSNLEPGDLVFFYKPIGHVGIYIGNGKMVHASRKGQPVKVSNVNWKNFNSARRV